MRPVTGTHALLILNLLVSGTLTGHAAQRYTIRPLEITDDQADVYAKGINNVGQVVGYTINFLGQSQAVVWDAEGVRSLPGLAEEAPQSKAFRINQAGQIVGLAITSDGAAHAAMWEGGEIVDIGVLEGGANSFANDINEQGVVVGSSEAEVGSHAFTWTAEQGFVDYGNTDPPFRLAVAGFNGVNNNGLLVGTIYILLEPYHATMAREGDQHVTDISLPGRTSVGMALAVNDAGTIVGYQNDGSGSPEAAIFLGEGQYQPLGHLGLGESWAQDINASGTIVGQAFGFGAGVVFRSAFVYEDGEMADLYTLIPQHAGWESLIEASAINDLGWIAGEGIYDGRVRAFLAIPVPEPAASGLVWCSIAWLAARRRREQ